jgi:secreted trypsin-like serine protease
MKKVLALWFALHVVCSCAVEDAPIEQDNQTDEVIRGTRDRGRNPAVVALRTTDGLLCSGTLITPRAVLTARHCVSYVPPTVNCNAAMQVFGMRNARSYTVYTSEDVVDASPVARGERIVVPQTDKLCGSDVAIVVLDRDVAGITPLGISDSPLAPAHRVTVSGYGRRGDSSRAGVGVHYTRTNVKIDAVTETEFVTGESVCSGDSGGPAIDARTGLVVGVLSRGTERCVGVNATAIWTRAMVARPLLSSLR